MPPSSPTLHDRASRHKIRPTARLLVLLAAVLACPLAACSSSRSPAQAEAKVYQQRRAVLLELVACARQRGLNMQEPEANNSISTTGLKLNEPRRKAAMNYCFHKAQARVARESEAERSAQGQSAGQVENQASTPGSPAFIAERQHVMQVVSCARRHGLNLPDPDSHNDINTRGLHLNNPHNKRVMNNCFHDVLVSVSREQKEDEEAQRRGRVWLGSEPTG